MIDRIQIENREQWLALRRQDVTASVVAATMGLHPYVSKLALFKESPASICLNSATRCSNGGCCWNPSSRRP